MSTTGGQPRSMAGVRSTLKLPSGSRPASSGGRLPPAIGKYQVLSYLGTGAMGVVYKCRQPGLDRPVAVKVMRASRIETEEQLRRFEREAQSAARLTHPNVVQIYDVGAEGLQHYLVMEYVDGVSLDRLIGSVYLTVDTTLRIVFHLLQGLQAAHDRGIIHRDIKPSNILVDSTGRPRIADFGLAKSLTDERSLSGSGDLIGTPRYMSPEQILVPSSEVDARTDIYSLGVVMYEMLTGLPPIDGPNILVIMRHVTDDDPQDLRQANREVPEPVAAICSKAMAKDKSQRYSTAREFATAIQEYLLARVVGSGGPPAAPQELMSLLAPPVPPAIHRPPDEVGGSRLLAIAAVLLPLVIVLGTLPVWWKTPESPTSPVLPSDKTGGPAPTDDYPKLRAKLLPSARERLHGPLRMAERMTPRDSLKEILDDLTALLKQAPQDAEARLLRARALRRGGELLSAIGDASAVPGADALAGEASLERAVAGAQLHLLYLRRWNDALLRFPPPDSLRAESDRLNASADPTQKTIGRLVDALLRQDASAAESLAKPPPASMWAPDVSMLQAELLFQAAEQALTEEEQASDDEQRTKIATRRRRLARLAQQSLRQGLDADPHHVGLLFLKADALQSRVVWDMGEIEDRDTALGRSRAAFETARDRFRRAALRSGCESALAQAVLLANRDRGDQALELINDALSSRPTVAGLHTMKAWLRLQWPPDGVLREADLTAISRDFEPAFESDPDEPNPFFVRALLHVAGGRWDDAARDLRHCQRLLEERPWTGLSWTKSEWLRTATTSTTEFLYLTRDVLNELSVTPELRRSLHDALLARLSDANIVQQDLLDADHVASMKAWSHFSLAALCAGQDDRDGVLAQIREALSLKRLDLVPQTFRDDGTFSAWNEDPEFVALYKEFE